MSLAPATSLSRMAEPAVELHIVSDSTGETAARLVLALEAQFPEQAFEEVRHTRAETVAALTQAGLLDQRESCPHLWSAVARPSLRVPDDSVSGAVARLMN